MQKYAVIGNPISHSLSPRIHQLFAKQCNINLQYEKIHVSDNASFAATITDFFLKGGKGLNITAPFKEQAFNIATLHTERCDKARAANTLWMQHGQLHADTTDGIGLIRALAPYIKLDDKKVMIIGAGGSARSIIAPLLSANIKALHIVNRTPEKMLALKNDFPQITIGSFAQLHTSYDLIINTIPVGFEEFYQQQLPTCILSANTYCYDLVYNIHEATAFTSWARSLGATAHDGLSMLIEQAAEAFYIWHNVMPQPINPLIFIDS